MSKEAQSHELTYDLIKRAVHGDQEAIEAYLLHYDAYINSLVMYDEVGPDGQLHSYIDEDMKIQVQMKIVDALQNKWRKLMGQSGTRVEIPEGRFHCGTGRAGMRTGHPDPDLR